ncbi:putative lipoprotein [Plasticicumulans lactativorans]|uniref:Putative lipoprotein n=1 Tax=Plasticicumulans lactativorans TaxID=1133106 RepID=A0A4V2SBL8_9GAMM|nr:lipoprotein [Plasticicumulans lactativorans]TCO76000.1 putative lipoprotein [Plasticicumulans lactativorans]
MKATVARALLALLAVAVLAGCGLKGPLYQPPPETPKPAKPAKPAG